MSKLLRYCLFVLFSSGVIYADEVKTLEIPFVSKAPRIDGKLDDEAWQKAAITSEFKKYSTGAVSANKTVARLCYDTNYLYIAFECSQKGEIVAIVNQEAIDAPVFKDDNVELFFAPAEKGHMFHLGATYRGTRWDALDEKPELWDGKWKCASSRDSNGWIIEFRIPFTDLAQFNFPQGTPAAGDIWKVNFSRTYAVTNEWSQWSFSKNGGFGDRNVFVPVTFGKRHPPYDLTTKVNSTGALTIGKSEIKLDLEKVTFTPLDVCCALEEKTASGWTDKVIYMRTFMDIGASHSVKIPYKLDKGGEYKFNIAVKSNKVASPLSTWATHFTVVDLSKDINALQTKTSKIQDLNAKLTKSAFKSDSEKQLIELQKILAEVKQSASNTENMTSELWGNIEGKAGNAVAAADIWERKVQKQAWRESLNIIQKDAEFCVGNASIFDQIFREGLFEDKINQPMQVKSAKYEMEDLQIVIIPLTEAGVKNVTVEMSDMKQKDGNAVLSSAQWKIGEIQYIEKPRPANAGNDFRAFWPDVIMPYAPINVSANWQTPVSLRVKVPADQAAGIYNGALTVKNDKTSFDIPIELEVFDFALPKAYSLKTESWLTFLPLRKYYKNNNVTLEHYERILKDFEGYRISMGLNDYFTVGPKLKLIREEDGRLTVDFSEFDKWIDLAIKYDANAFNLNLSCSDGMMTMFAGGWGYPMLKITDRKTGKVSPYPKKCKWPAPETYDNPDFISFWQQYWAHAKEKGWDKIAFVENVDEPVSDDRKAWFIKTHTFFRKYCPGLKLRAYGPTPIGFKQAVGLMDQWAPLLHNYEEEEAEFRKRQEAGESVWVYTCGSPGKNPQGGYTPEVYLDTPLLDKRVTPMMCWKYNIDGLYQFTINTMDKAPDGKFGKYPFLHAPPTMCQFGNGDQIWPGAELFQMLSSLRLEMMRDGREDYEYLMLLRNSYNQLKAKNNPADKVLLNESSKYLQVPEELVKDPMTWSHDPGKWINWRNNLARQIVKLQQALK